MPNSENHIKRNVGPNKVHEKPKNFKKAIFELLSYDKKLKPFYIIAMIFAVMSSICSIIGPNKISDLTDIKDLMSLNIFGAICGKSIYEGTLNLPKAIKLTRG